MKNFLGGNELSTHCDLATLTYIPLPPVTVSGQNSCLITNILFCLQEAVPFAVVGSNTIIEVKGKKVRGRMYPWGVVEVENPDHCDFIKLRTMLM